jgi:hypothetical protein
MKLLIAGKYIQIDDFVELVTENPLTNNWDTQYAQYSNNFEVKYAGYITDLLDISKLRITDDPYLFVDGFLLADEIFIPVQILITSFDVQKNTIKMNVTERILSGIVGGVDVRTTKLTELRYSLNLGGIVEGEYTDLIVLSDGTTDVTPIGGNLYIAETPVLAADQDYPHTGQPDNSCLLVSLSDLVSFFDERYGLTIENCPIGNVFANRQKANQGDLIKCEMSQIIDFGGEVSVYIKPVIGEIIEYPAGVENIQSALTFGNSAKLTTYINRIGDSDGRFITCRITVPISETYTPANWSVLFKNQELDLIEVDDRTMVFGIADIETEFSENCDSYTSEGVVILFEVTCTDTVIGATFEADIRMNISIADNNEIATPANTRQVLQNLPDITILEFYKQIAKATASAIELTDTGIKFIDLGDTLTGGAIVDASQYLISIEGIDYKLFDAPAIEYWYKKAETVTLIIPITDSRVSGDAKKIDIDIIRTDDENVILFEDNALTPIDGIATFPFLDITGHAPDLLAFYLSIQKPFIVRAKFRNFDLSLSNSILVRQLNGVFIPKKIIKTNRDVIELELLKIES